MGVRKILFLRFKDEFMEVGERLGCVVGAWEVELKKMASLRQKSGRASPRNTVSERDRSGCVYIDNQNRSPMCRNRTTIASVTAQFFENRSPI